VGLEVAKFPVGQNPWLQCHHVVGLDLGVEKVLLNGSSSVCFMEGCKSSMCFSLFCEGLVTKCAFSCQVLSG
jgi:hypothetical protein